MAFDTIKKIVDYSQKLFSGWQLSFTITTNAVLLDDHIIEYFVEKDFLTFISLDGPEENHDAKRVFYNGSGSFSIVKDRLEFIKEIYPLFYEKNVTFTVVYSKDLSLEKVFDFFSNNPLVNKSNIRFGSVNEMDTDYYNIYPFKPEKMRSEREKVYSSVLNKKQNKIDLTSIENNLLSSHQITENLISQNKFSSLMGACFYDSRLYIDADGHFHICEKINNHFSFGSADEGFDYEKMAALVNDYTDFLNQNCQECAYKFLCQRCYIHFAKDGKFQMDERFCASQKYTIKRLLEEIIQMRIMEEIK